MARFKQGIESSNQKTNKPELKYSDLELVNFGGFKVPKIVRRHWNNQANESDEKIATVLREFLIERYGLPDGIDLDSFSTKKPENQ